MYVVMLHPPPAQEPIYYYYVVMETICRSSTRYTAARSLAQCPQNFCIMKFMFWSEA